MPNAKFILKEPTSKEETLVYLIYRYHYNRFKYSTGEKITSRFWNTKTQRAKNSKDFPEYPEFNHRLDIIENGINTTFRKLLNEGIQPNNALLKERLELELSDQILKPTATTLFEFINDFIKTGRATRTKGTIKGYVTVFNHLKQFALINKLTLDFNSINQSFYNDYLKYLRETCDLADNTIGRHIRTLKTFLNDATDKGLNKNLDYKKKNFKTIGEEADTIYLSQKELKIIEEINLFKSPRLDKVRDLFLIGCYTGLRFSDFIQIKPQNVSDNYLQIRTQKIGERVVIPLNSVVKNILAKYNNTLPKAYANQVMNRYLKELGEKAEIDQKIEISITKGGEIRKSAQLKYNLITTHTARRSFATNLYLADVPAISIMKMTGHRTERSFLKYIRVTQEQNADKLVNHPFFN